MTEEKQKKETAEKAKKLRELHKPTITLCLLAKSQ